MKLKNQNLINIFRYLKLYFAFAKNCLLRELEFRANFIIGTVFGILWSLVSFVSIGIIFDNTGEIAGWNQSTAILLVFVYYVSNSLYRATFHTNIEELSSNIKNGDLDLQFLKPVNTKFLVLFRKVNYTQVIRTIVFFVGLAVYSFRIIPSLTIYNFLLAIGLIIIGCISFSLVVFSVNCYLFWKPRIWNLMFLTDRLRQFSELPADIYGGWFRIIIFALPVAVYSTVPAKFILGQGSIQWFLYSLIMFILTLIIANSVWKAGLKKYESASS